MSKVAIVRGIQPIEVTAEAIKMVGPEVDLVLSQRKPVLTKPNYINSRHPSTGITTDSQVIEGVVKFLREQGVEKIVIGEGNGFADTFQAFQVAGVDAVALRWGAKLVDVNRNEFVEVNPPNSLALRKVTVAKTALESTIISVPKLKPHRMAIVSLSLKNMMGALANKGSAHTGGLSKSIVDLASVLKPSISVIDGIIAGEGHETSADPVQMNLVIAGTDPVAVDAVGAAVMGLNPVNVKHLRLTENIGLGTCNLERITILGEPVDKVKRNLRRSLLSKLLAHIG